MFTGAIKKMIVRKPTSNGQQYDFYDVRHTHERHVLHDLQQTHTHHGLSDGLPRLLQMHARPCYAIKEDNYRSGDRMFPRSDRDAI